MPIERASGGLSLIEARVVVASIDTYLKYSEAVGASVPVARPALESRAYDELVAENKALRAEISSNRDRERQPVARRRRTPRA